MRRRHPRVEHRLKFRNVFLAEINDISKNTRSPNQVIEAMKRIMDATNRRTHSLYVLDLLKTLNRRGIGTAAVEQLTARLCRNGKGRVCVVETVMKNKIRDAYKEVRKLRYQNEKIWREED